MNEESEVSLEPLAKAATEKGWTVKGRKPTDHGKRTGAAAIVRDYLRSRPDKIVGSKEMQMVLASRIPGIQFNAASGALIAMARRGELFNPEPGAYRWKSRQGRPKGSTRSSKRANGAATSQPAIAASVAFGVSAATGDAALDEDLVALDTALAALGQIEAVVRKHRGVFAQLAALKRALAGG